MFRDIVGVSIVAMHLRVLRLLRGGVALLLVGVVPQGRDLQQLYVVIAPLRGGVTLPVAASAASRFHP